MLVIGIANPSGEKEAYNGLYFRDSELRSMAPCLSGTPVKAEHVGENLGSVVSAFVDDNGRLNCVMRIDESSVEGAIAAGLVRSGVAADLSMGYAVDVRQSAPDQLRAEHKRVLEVSLVRKGAREGCHIVGHDGGNHGLVLCNTSEQSWQHFDLR